MQASLRFLLLGILAVNALPSNNRQKDPKLVDGDPTLPAARRQLGENGGRLSLPLIRRHNKALLNEEEHREWAQRQVQSLRAKYDIDGLHERATGTARLVNREYISSHSLKVQRAKLYIFFVQTMWMQPITHPLVLAPHLWHIMSFSIPVAAIYGSQGRAVVSVVLISKSSIPTRAVLFSPSRRR